MGKVTTHILDTSRGVPAKGVGIALYRLDEIHDGDGQKRTLVVEAVTNEDGRCGKPLMEGDEFVEGNYEFEFDIGAYFKSPGEKDQSFPFLNTVILRVGLSNRDDHYHVPLLVSPFGYSTYRGS